jgi:hypothetical protein
VEQTQTPQTWRELLSVYVDDPQMRQGIADALGVNPITLTRWIKQQSIPRPQNLRRLLTVLTPQDRLLFLSLVDKEVEGFSTLLQDEMIPSEPLVIPPEVYKRVLHTCATIPKRLRFSSLCDLILSQALKQLDPHRFGMSIIVACCMPPSYDHKVRTLREIIGKGTAPWGDQLEQQAVLLGVESLAGYAVASSHLVANQKLEGEHGLSFGYRATWEESAVAAPIMLMGRIAGSLLVSSTQPEYFTPMHCALVESYAELVALAFDPVDEDFYELERIQLSAVPPAEEQRPYLAGFRQRVVEIMAQGMRDGHPMIAPQAELIVWQQVEAELLHLPPPGEVTGITESIST